MATNPPTASDRDARRAATWLGLHGVWGVAPTPLLVARLTVRRRFKVGTGVAVALLIVAFAVSQGWMPSVAPSTDSVAWLLTILVMGLAAVVIRWLGMYWVARAERRLAAALPLRVADPVHAGWRELLGYRRWLVVVLYGGAVAVAAVAVALGDARTGAAAAVVLAAVVVFVALDTVAVASVLRRPALAEDEVSLRVDAALRAEDVNMSSNPVLPVFLASQVAGGPDLPDWLLPAAMVLLVALIPDGIMLMTAGRPPRSTARTPAPQP